MRSLMLASVAVSIATSAARAQKEPPLPPDRVAHGMVVPKPLLSSKALCERADMIVEGVVERSAVTSTNDGLGGGSNQTYFLIAVSRVIKGPPDTHNLVASETGGALEGLRQVMNYPLMQTGERYVLFLYSDNRVDPAYLPGLFGLPYIPGLARYRDDIFYGRYLVDKGQVRLHLPKSDHTQFDGLTPEAFAHEIAAQLAKTTRKD